MNHFIPHFFLNFSLLFVCQVWVIQLIEMLFFRFALPPFFLCPETSTFIGGGSVLVTAALYGVLAVGKK